MQTDYQMAIYGHRGAAGEAPENTIAACRHAIERGVRRIEIDVQLSADQQLVVAHDKSLRRTCAVAGNVADYTAAQLTKLDGRNDGPRWTHKKDTGVPSLDKLLSATPEIEHYQLEVKPDSRRSMLAVAHLLAERLAEPAVAERCVVTSSSAVFLKLLAEQAPQLQRGIVATLPNAYVAAVELGVEYFCMHWSICVPYLVGQLRRRGMKASVWTVNDPQTIKSLHKMRVHSIITDYPSMAIPWVSALER